MERLLNPSSVKGHTVPDIAELNEEALMLLTAGNDTTANAMIFGVYFICKHPSVRWRLEMELQVAFPDSKRGVSYNRLKLLPYLVCWHPSVKAEDSLSRSASLRCSIMW